MEDRISVIECKLMDLEDQIDTLNLTVFRQQQTIDRLERQIVELKMLAVSRMTEERRPPEDEIPPHY